MVIYLTAPRHCILYKTCKIYHIFQMIYILYIHKISLDLFPANHLAKCVGKVYFNDIRLRRKSITSLDQNIPFVHISP